MKHRALEWPAITGAVIVLGLVLAARGDAQFTSFNDRSGSILEGNWQSCRGSEGEYSERIYDGKTPAVGAFELHLGPYHDFALFRGVQNTHRDHDSPDNLLTPHTVDVRNSAGSHTWNVEGLRLAVALAGGSREECESWWVTLRRADTSSY